MQDARWLAVGLALYAGSLDGCGGEYVAGAGVSGSGVTADNGGTTSGGATGAGKAGDLGGKTARGGEAGTRSISRGGDSGNGGRGGSTCGSIGRGGNAGSVALGGRTSERAGAGGMAGAAALGGNAGESAGGEGGSTVTGEGGAAGEDERPAAAFVYSVESCSPTAVPGIFGRGYGDPNTGSLVASGTNGAVVSCTVAPLDGGDFQMHGVFTQLDVGRGAYSFSFSSVASVTSSSSATLSFEDGAMRLAVPDGFPACSLGPPLRLAAGEILADIDCPLFARVDDGSGAAGSSGQGIRCHLWGRFAFEHCDSSE
jgi:hypothetical protein